MKNRALAYQLHHCPARHNSSLLDAHILKPGDDTEDIPDSYVIFITENDVMKGNQPIYPVKRYFISISLRSSSDNRGTHSAISSRVIFPFYVQHK